MSGKEKVIIMKGSVEAFAEFVVEAQKGLSHSDSVSEWDIQTLATCYKVLSERAADVGGAFAYDVDNLRHDFVPFTERWLTLSWAEGLKDEYLPDRDKVVHSHDDIWVEYRLQEEE